MTETANPITRNELLALIELFNAGHHTEMEAIAAPLAAQNPRHGVIWKLFGAALQAQGKDALNALQTAAVLLSHDADCHSNLGNELRIHRQYEEAVNSCRRAIAIKPDFAEAHSNLGAALVELRRYEEAESSFRRSLALQPDRAEVHNNLGSALHKLGRIDEAEASLMRALQRNPRYAEAYFNLENIFHERGDLNRALACLGHGLQLKPEHADGHSTRLNLLNYLSSADPHAMLAAAKDFGAIATKKARPFESWLVAPNPHRPLRIGLVSGDLREHPVSYFLASVLEAVAGRIEVFAYANHFASDQMTERVKACCHRWQDVTALPDEVVANLIRNDRIDILLDLSGHTSYNRLTMFAWKPAPVQAAWLGYYATTGLPAMDYVFADPLAIPAGGEWEFTESVWRFPEIFSCFSSPDFDLPVAPLPALENGYVTFGSFNNLLKINDEVIATWARVLHAVPDSRLLMKARQFLQPRARDEMQRRFARHGIAFGRLILEGGSPRAELLACYARVDIALDTFPYTGCTTTAEALWMGVPVMSMMGDRFLGRQSASMLNVAGLTDWISASPDDYVTRVASHADNLRDLAMLRNTLRDRAMHSPLFDALRFAGNFEAALRGMWQRYCEKPPKVV